MALCTSLYWTPSKQFPSLSTIAPVKIQRRPRINLPWRNILNLPIHKECILPLFIYLSGSCQCAFQSRETLWEEPDDGSGSEYDEEDPSEQGNDLDFESDWEEETSSSLVTVNESFDTAACQQDFVKEIEELLNPEERAILEANKTPNIEKLSTAKWILLHTLALSGQIQFIDKLLENGINIDFADKLVDGLTALHVAVMGKKESVISHLLRKGANPHVKDKDGASLLHYAVQVGAMQTVKLLIKYKVDVNVADNEGWTPLHIAMQCRNRDIAKVLLVNGADSTRRNKDGISPLDLSLAYGKEFKSYDLAKLVKLISVNRGF